MKVGQLCIFSIAVRNVAAATLRRDSERDLAVLYYPKYSGDFNTGYCTSQNTGAGQGYSTELACCKAYFGGQTSGFCYSKLPNPPTASPTTADGGLDVWYPDYKTPFETATCINDGPLPNGVPTYDSQLACCKAAYLGQTSGACLSKLPFPPTASPTGTGGLDIWYADYDLDWTAGKCINTAPIPNGRQTYDSQLACCKAAYNGQASGACLSDLPSPPTVSPTGTGGLDIWYADYDLDWTAGKCINTAPIPNGRQTYDSQLACCKAAYNGQASGACLSDLPSPPTVSPTGTGGLDIWYADYDLDWTAGKCINTAPIPNGRQTYDSQLACCKAAYNGQASGACLSDLPSPPTVSPTGTGGLDIWYADYDLDWTAGKCINTAPIPNGRQTYDSQLACCKAAYNGQASGACLSDLPSPPTVSPTGTGGLDIWYADYDLDWTAGKCINTAPIPNGRQTYDSQLACCKAAYNGQASGACLSDLPSPPTVSPTGTGGLDIWYADYDLDWTAGKCINTAPIPNGRQTYDSQLACCKGAYSGQASGACLGDLPSAPTAAPIGASSKFFPIWSGWETGHCDNDPTKITSGNTYFYDTQAECCDAWFKDQTSNACLRFDPTYGSRSPTQAPVL
ncbi:hypothetical protein HJC23_006433 [Cyclotella cryptica]|uniref:Uncharacterized protein n=1 Tax=Cyclotella cryptica TaxID=29204 RepID=A0ABD3QU07_9STRA|eukprot:CCRYP_001836-RA/>CCRYP_001836-RA protein AED:0.06 eAED:0.06 QI:0/-1/0/1/-1/1/1/0/622